MTMTRSIQGAATETGLSADTLRYYERIGVLPGIARTSSGHRRFSEGDIGWIKLVQCLRATGMSIQELHRYAMLMQEGDSTAEERLQLLESTGPGSSRPAGARNGTRARRTQDRGIRLAAAPRFQRRAAGPPTGPAQGSHPRSRLISRRLRRHIAQEKPLPRSSLVRTAGTSTPTGRTCWPQASGSTGSAMTRCGPGITFTRSSVTTRGRSSRAGWRSRPGPQRRSAFGSG